MGENSAQHQPLPQLARDTTREQPWPLRLLNTKIAEYVAKMSTLWVEGEIINLTRRPGAKVQFFELTDLKEKSSIRCKMFSHALPAGIDDGTHVVIQAKPEFWGGNGTLSLHVSAMHPVGDGDILARIEALKAQLAREGLFNLEHKKPLPFLPRKIGLIVGRNTKALDDVRVNAWARWPAAEFEVREVVVQGDGAVESMIPALRELDAMDDVDIIVLARGGGAIRDLFPFSDERLVRAAFDARTPIVSAIGHETDSPILDLVADFRASTPTDAARRIVPDVGEERTGVREALRRGRIAVDALIERATSDIEAQRSRPIMANPLLLVEAREDDVANLLKWSRNNFERLLSHKNKDLNGTLGRLRTLSPRSTLERGYAVLIKDDGSVLTSATKAKPGEHISGRVVDGTIDLTISTPGARHDS